MPTPEGKVKKLISALLDRYAPDLYYYMPVPAGYGAPSLDYIGFFYGFGFVIEAKAPGKKPSLRQEGTIERIEASHTKVFVVDGDLQELDTWLVSVQMLHGSIDDAE